MEGHYSTHVGNPFQSYLFRRVAADRDIRPEKDGDSYADIHENTLDRNGTGATTVVQRILQTAKLNEVSLPSSLIDEIILTELNSIYGPDVNLHRDRAKAE